MSRASSKTGNSLTSITDTLNQKLRKLSFKKPVTHVYNPLEYARQPWDAYCNKFGGGTKRILFLGMNPGPFGMAQCGVPFGEIAHVKEWLGINETVGMPKKPHPKRPVSGFDCQRSEVSGRRFWSWAKARFHEPEHFFSHAFVANYCPLVFMEESGRNRVPEKLPKEERLPLFEACDEALLETIDLLQPQFIVGIGKFAEKKAKSLVPAESARICSVPHPSPASPIANRGWAPLMDAALEQHQILF